MKGAKDDFNAVPGDLRFIELTAGVSHICGIDAEHSAYCWGNGGGGRLGTGSSNVDPLPVQGGLHFVSISAGSSHTCAVTTDAKAYCWGDNFKGELGVDFAWGDPGYAYSQPFPTPIAVDLAIWEIYASEWEHTCAITMTGEAYCWGMDLSGQIGWGVQEGYRGRTTALRPGPTPVAPPIGLAVN
ncbi:MAG: RCC1 domain-containing protein [Gemmatimonadaceae bacterium]